MFLLKGILFAGLLLWASLQDLRTREIPDRLSLGILGVGLINISFLPAILGMFVASFPFYVAAVLSNGKIGGGDVKLMAACGFMLGVSGGILQTIIGLSLTLIASIVLHFISGFKSTKNLAMPLAPFLAVGGIVAFWIIHLN